MSPNVQPDTDLGQNYVAYRSSLDEQAAGAALLREMQGAPKEPGAAPESEPAPRVPPGGAPGAALDQPGIVSRIGSAAGAVGKDVTKGVLQESARGVYTGSRNAVQETYDKIDDLADWTTKKLGIENLGIPIPGMNPDAHVSDLVRQWMDKKEIADPSTVTGKLIQGVAQFVTGLALTKGVAPGGAGAVASAARGAESLAVAFDPHQQRLSNLIEQFPVLSNPVTQFLQSKPDDSEALGMFKNAVEGTGIGELAGGFVKAVRLLKDVGQGADAAIPTPAPALPEDAFKVLGDSTAQPGEPILRTETPPAAPEPGVPVPAKQGLTPEGLQAAVAKEGAPEQVPSSAAGREMTPPKTFINFARIDAPTDVQRAMQEIADARAAPADSAKAGVMTFEDVKASAAQQNAWNILKARNQGEPLPADQMTAARQLWLQSTAKMVETARHGAKRARPRRTYSHSVR